MHRPVLLVIDMLNDFLDRWEPASRAELVGTVNELASTVRAAGHTVIWVRQEFAPDMHDALPEMRTKGLHMLVQGTPGCQMDAGLDIQAEDIVIVKKRYSAFFRTDLDEVLEHLQPDMLIVAGINTHACVRTTVIDAYQRDWPVVLALDAIDSYDRAHHDVSLAYMKDKLATVLTNKQIRSALAA